MARICKHMALVLLIVGMNPMGMAPAGQSTEPARQFVLRLMETVKEVQKADPDNQILLSPEAEKRNMELASLINRMLDIDHISQYALMNHWKTLQDPDRRLFVSVFTDLLTKVAYPNAAKFLKDLEVSIRKEKQIRNRSMVYASVIHQEEGRIDIDFKLIQTDRGWVVTDIYLDEVSLARNLRTQCLKIIRDHSFEELIARMGKKIAERDTAELKEVTGRD